MSGKSEESKTHRIALLGHPGVGKTSLAGRLIGGEFELTDITHGTDYSTIFDENIKFAVPPTSLIDFSGSSPEELLTKIQKEEFSIALVVVDPTSNTVKDDIGYWSKVLRSRTEGQDVTSFLVLARVDVGVSNLGSSELKAFSDKYGYFGSYQTSAKDGSGIQELRSAVLNASTQEEEEATLSAVELLVRILAEELCQLVAENPNSLEEIEWRDLERMLAVALEKIGFDVKLTPPSKDGGKDIVLYCKDGNGQQTFYVEIKHWRKGGRPGLGHISDFIEVNAEDNTNGGLFISSSGFTEAAYSRLSEISKQCIGLGGKDKIISLCQNYVRKVNGVWDPEKPLPELLFEDTLSIDGRI